MENREEYTKRVIIELKEGLEKKNKSLNCEVEAILIQILATCHDSMVFRSNFFKKWKDVTCDNDDFKSEEAIMRNKMSICNKIYSIIEDAIYDDILI